MNRRLYFVIPDVEASRRVEDDLLLGKIDDQHMHFLAKGEIDVKDLPGTGTMQRSDGIHGIVIGAVVGLILGILLAKVTNGLPDGAFFKLGWMWFASLPVLGGVIGLLISDPPSKRHTPHHHHQAFEDALEEGHVLLMVDIPVHRVDEIREIIKSHCPEAEDHGIDPNIPAFP
jgi:hypothetical protein